MAFPPDALPKIQRGVGQKQRKNHEEIEPMTDNAGGGYGGFNHPRNRTPEVGEELQDLVGFFFGDRVGPYWREAFLSFGLAEASGEDPSFFWRSAIGMDFRSSPDLGFASGFKSSLA